MKRSGDPLYASEINELFAGFERPVTAGTGLHFSHGPGGSHVGISPEPTGPTLEATALTFGLNTGAAALPSYSPCEIVGSVFSGTAAEQRRALQVRAPTGAARNKFAVCAQPLAVGRAGRIHVAGVCLCRVRTNSGDLYADIASSGDTFLTGSPIEGGAQILWEDGGSSLTTHLALIRFPYCGLRLPEVRVARVATTAPITLSGTQTIDGVDVNAGDWVLVRAQTDGVGNGYLRCESGDWYYDASSQPTVVCVREGSTNARLIFFNMPDGWIGNSSV